MLGCRGRGGRRSAPGPTAKASESIFAQLDYDLTGLARVKAGRDAEPTAAVIDTQSAKTSTSPPTTTQGTGAVKKVAGRKCGIATDALGLPLAVIVTAASISPAARLLVAAKREAVRPGGPAMPPCGVISR